MNNQLIQSGSDISSMVCEVESMKKVCADLMKTKHYSAMGEAGLFALMQKAKCLGIAPMEALNGGLYFVQGKVGMSTEMMASLIREKGHSICKDIKSDNTICVLHGKRSDNGDTWTVSFSMQDAQRAGLAKNMYDKYPAIMLYNRAMSTLARQLFPDVIKGAGYTMEELREIADNNPAPKREQFQHVSENTQETVSVVVEKISQEQADDLVSILEYCEPDFQTQVLNFIRKSPYNAETVKDIPLSIYERIKSGAMKNKEKAEAEAKIDQMFAGATLESVA